jgi:hypothetical protein
MTKMLGADSFPYSNETITEAVYQKATQTLDRAFFVGLQSECSVSMGILRKKLGVVKEDMQMYRFREQSSKDVLDIRKDVYSNEKLMEELRRIHSWDLRLYAHARKIFCTHLAAFPEMIPFLSGSREVCLDGVPE